MMYIRGLLVVGLFAAGLLLVAPGCGKKGGSSGATTTGSTAHGTTSGKPGSSTGAGKAANDMIVGEWHGKLGDDTVTLEFDKQNVKFKAGNKSGQGEYEVKDKTLTLPKMAKPAENDAVTIDSISAEKMVLSGGADWKFNKTELKKK